MANNDFLPDRLEALVKDSGASFCSSGKSWIFDCPKCKEKGKDGKDKLYIRKRDGLFRCWVCADDGFKGRPEYALAEILGVPVFEVEKKLYTWTPDRATVGRIDLAALGFGDSDQDIYVEEGAPPILPEVYWPLGSVDLDHPHAAKGLAYLAGRGADLEACRAANLRYWPRERQVLTPIVVHGRMVGYQGRVTYSTTPFVNEEGKLVKPLKTITSENLARDQVLVFHDEMLRSDHAILCEGPFDALQCRGLGGAVASMGKVVSRTQVELVRAAGCRRLYLALDPDAIDSAAKVAREHGDGLDVWLMEPLAGYKDFGEMSPRECIEAFGLARRVLPGQIFVRF